MKHRELFEKEVNSENETRVLTKTIVRHFKIGDTVLLYGNLGSGKTFLVREFAKLLGSDDDVSSPTFTLINRYEGEVTLHHIDLYRIENDNELNNLGLGDILNMDSINFIEWPERIENRIEWPHFRLHLAMNLQNPTWRKLNLLKYE